MRTVSRTRWWIGAALAAALVVLPAAGAGAQVPSRDLTVMTYNIATAVLTENDVAPIANYIRTARPDVVALQEVDLSWSRSDSVDQAAEIARRLGMRFAFDPNVNCAPRDVDDDGYCFYGTAILSRFPFVSGQASFYGLPRFAFREPRGLARVRLDVNGRPFEVFNTHLSFIAPERRAQVNAVLRLTGGARPPHVLMGDLNALPFAPEIVALRRRFVDAPATRGLFRTPTTNSPSPVRLDYVFASRGISVLSARVMYARLSDHRPVVVRLRLPA